MTESTESYCFLVLTTRVTADQTHELELVGAYVDLRQAVNIAEHTPLRDDQKVMVQRWTIGKRHSGWLVWMKEGE